MKKTEFLTALRKKLKILNEEEKKDIINEYEDIIKEKIKKGMTEEEAVADFGDINDLAKEILKAYKVDPEYNKYADTLETGKETFDENVKKAANWLGDKTKDLFEDEEKVDITVEKVFEIIIKVFVVLILLNILRIPVNIIAGLGGNIFASSIFPFSLLQYLWLLIIEFLYIIGVIFIIFIIFKDVFFIKKSEEKKEKPVAKTKKTTEKTKEEKQEVVKHTKPTENPGIAIVKIVLIIIFAFPLLMLSFGLMMTLAASIYLLIKGVMVYGLIVLLIGILILIFFFLSVVFDLINNKKTSFWPLLIAFIIILVGLFLTIDWALNLKIERGTAQELTSSELIIPAEELHDNFFWQNQEIIADQEIAYGDVLVTIFYNQEYESLVTVTELGNMRISVTNWEALKTFNQVFIEKLKEDVIYIPYYKIEVAANEMTIKTIIK